MSGGRFLPAVVVAAATLAGFASEAHAQVRVQCESRNYSYQFCPLDGRLDGVWLIEQRSRSACIEGRTWGWDPRGIWVDRGCEGIFEARSSRPVPARVPDRGNVMTCESRNYQYEFCQGPDAIVSARLVVQRSGAACIEGRTWGWRPNGIWVSGGCEGDFEFRTGYVAPPPPRPAVPEGLMYCESRDYQYTFCPTGRVRVVELVNQRSQAACVYGTTWGYQNDGVWVDRGCAAEFAVRPR